MALKDDLARAEQTIERQGQQIGQLKDRIIGLEEELRHYRTAIAAVRWLWEQAAKQRPFQL